MIESVNNSNPLAASALRSQANEQQDRAQAEQAEAAPERSVTAPAGDSVSLSAVSGPPSSERLSTSLQNTDQASQSAARVVNLFQQQPELAATAQGGQVTPEKADAYLKASIG